MMKPDITLEAFAWKVSRDAMDHVEECNKRIEEIAKERDGLWAQVATLREALSAIAKNVDENLTESFGPFAEDREANDPQGVAVLERARTALAATPAQALDAFTAPLVAQSAALREALRLLVGFSEMEGTNGIDFFEARNAGIALLSRTPADSLETYRRKVLNQVESKLRDKASELGEGAYDSAADLVRRMAGKE